MIAAFTRRSPDERMLEVGQDLLDPEQEPRHRGDRAHAEAAGVEPCARLAASGGGDPRAAAFGQGPGSGSSPRRRWPRPGRGRPRSNRTLVPCRPASSSSAARWRSSRPASSTPERRIAESRGKRARDAALQCPPRPARSARRRRPRRRTVDAATPRGLRPGRRRGGRSTRAPAGRRCRTARRRSGVPRRRGRSPGRRRALEDLHRDGGHGVLGAAGVLARRRDEPAREPQRPRPGPPASTTAETTASSTMAANVPERRAHAPRGQPGPQSRRLTARPGQPSGRGAAPARRGPPRPDAPGPTTLSRPPGRDLVPGRSHAGRGRGPGGDGPARDAEELGLAPEEVEVLGALAPVHTFVSSILIDAVRRVGLGRPGVRAQRGRDRARSSPTRSTSSRRPRPRWSGRRTGTCTAGSRTRCATEHGLGRDGRDPAPAARTAREPTVTGDDDLRAERPGAPVDPRRRADDRRGRAVLEAPSDRRTRSREFLQSKGYRIVPVNPNADRGARRARLRVAARDTRGDRDRRRRRVPPGGAHARGRRAGGGARREGALAAGGHRERRRAPDRRGRRPRRSSWACASRSRGARDREWAS